MRTLLASMLILISVSVLAETNYVYYSAQNGIPLVVTNSCSYDVGKDSVTMGGMTMGGIDWSQIRVGSFTDKIPKPFTNVSQVVLTSYLPLTKEGKARETATLQITPGVQALMDAMNKRLPATNKITDAELFSATTNRASKMAVSP